MSSFDDRESAFENKFAHDQELKFKVEARTSKLLGLWAAEKLGLTGAAAESYAKEVVASNLEEAGFGDVVRKVSNDFKDKKIAVSDHLIEKQVETLTGQARKDLMNS